MGFLLKSLSEQAGFTDERIRAERKPPPSPQSGASSMLGSYRILEEVPSAQGDECYVALLPGQEGFNKRVFLRVLPGRISLNEFAHAATIRAAINVGGIEQIYSVEQVSGLNILVSELVDGASLACIRSRLQMRSARLAWPVVFAIFNDAVARLANLHQAGLGLGTITPARIIIGEHGFVYLCQGLFSEDHTRTSDAVWGQDLCALAAPIFGLAQGVQPEEIEQLLSDGDAAAFDVLLDRVIESQPELEPLAVPVLLRRAERLRELPLPSEAADVERLLRDFLRPDDLKVLWEAVVKCL